ncbi:N(5),N(10)-methenyltetrahydromethanopterin cyclohydrolase [Azospirillum sp. TSH100]|uniref:methenyltetrahydromethanopterin cyclohydrolase n=1 Tax=Azospirillum sp. TSH100 TaxID=652764 RepID=UPI000D60421E|nr:methenyltetrahydromethanopterin cyclohydrolase [Azospirillum sp. TSH100]PWC88388.1 N(5),N(10)-methenyltetrahydromethanopterin cyclohydrolase [Azospirillum sp. TSH100]QCG90559.1 methenyltetrahydromethanopterin cyclohydrolase [Azospirillum sp. TSH100]
MTQCPVTQRPSLSVLSGPLAAALVADALPLRLGIDRVAGATVVDGGIGHPGGLEAGRRIAELCMGGLGRVTLQADTQSNRWPFQVAVHSTDPVLACLGSQYAGWSLSHKEEGESFFALGSGPGRALARKEMLFEELGYADSGDHAVLVLESGTVPPAPLVERIAADCRVAAERLTLVLTPTASLAGTVQIVARVLEVALHKVHALGFPLEDVADGIGVAPLPPPGKGFIEAMGRTNDAILFGGTVQLFVTGPDDAADDLARRLPSTDSRDYGRPFAEMFAAVNKDFYAIDPLLFAPARVVVTALDSGRSFHGGHLAPDMLDRSFAGTEG